MSHRFRILHIITRLDLGGSAENTLLTAVGLARRGHAVTILCGDSDNPPSLTEEKAIAAGVIMVRTRWLTRKISPVADCMALLVVWRYLRRHAFDIVHTHTSKAGIIGRIASVLAGKRAVVHTPHGHVFYGYFSKQLTRFFIMAERIMAPCTAMHITLTRREKDDYLALKIGTPETITPIFSGVELERFVDATATRSTMRRELGLAPDDFVVGTVARLVPVKNHDLLLSAAALLADTIPEARFVFVGDGECRPMLELRAAELNLRTRIIFAGWRNNIPDMLRAFDVFAMVSRNEGMGRAFVEAQAAGIPVIGSAVGGVPEVLDEGTTGWLVPSDDPPALAAVIERLAANRGALPALAERCRAWAQSKFGVETMVEKIEEVYRGIIEKGTEGQRDKGTTDT